jgi:hypothetical protein
MPLTLPTPAYPGAQGGYIPQFLGGETANLIVSYSRDVKKFAVNRLATVTPVDKMTGYFPRLNPEAMARIYNDPDEAVWPDGQSRPTGPQNKQDYSIVQYSTIRRGETYPLGYQERDQAQLPLRAAGLDVLAFRAMTRRAVAFYQKSLSTSYYLSTHQSSVATITGGSNKWSDATGTNPYIFQSLNYAATVINKATLGSVKMSDLTLVLTPQAAWKTAATQEVREYLARSQFALDQIRGDKPGQNANWGLPDKLYGMTVEVDETMQNTGNRLAAASNAYVGPDTSAVIMLPPGKSPAGQVSSSFSSWHFFVYQKEEMKTESFDDPQNARELLALTDNFGVSAVAPEASYLLTLTF